jgi:pimeloyl-ACP methyl ester carboxylesterase
VTPQHKSFEGLSSGGFHTVAYREWGPPGAERTAVCVHGLTRNGRDFDALAEHLAEAGWRVVCPDIAGRGASDRLRNPADYAYPQYLQDMTALIARLDVAQVDWVGTSMGGLIGMMLAAQPGGHPIRRLVVNDVGPFIPKAALERIREYVGVTWEFADLDAAERHVRRAYGTFGNLTDAQWRKLTEDSVAEKPGGGYVPNYDPHIGDAFAGQELQDVDLWSLWDGVSCPVLLLRGLHSDLLSANTAAQMTLRGPQATLIEVPDAGHAPALLSAAEVGTIRRWLAGEYDAALAPDG